MSSTSVRVFAPATVANVGCAYDLMGFAVHNPGDEVSLTWNDLGKVVIDRIEGDNGLLPRDPSLNTAGVAVLAYLKEQRIDRGVTISLTKNMPLGSGLGSSAASAAAALVAINHLCGDQLTRQQLLPFALQAEAVACGSAHADNVAPALLGGIVLILPGTTPRCISLPVPPNLHSCVVCPDIEIRTADARSILRPHISLATSVQQSGNVAGLVSALYTGDLELLGLCIEDFVVEPQRRKLIPRFSETKRAAINAGALGCSISGSGPSMFALTDSAERAAKCAEAMVGSFAELGIQAASYVSPINTVGATLCES